MKEALPSLFLSRLTLIQFKNYGQRTFVFNQKITGVTGRNGAGKTNLLDAVYYLCFTRSYFSSQEAQNVRYGTNGLRLQGSFIRRGVPEEIVCTVKEGKKEFLLNDTPYTRFSHHLGAFPAVMIAPDDAEIISGGSEERRRFLDTLLSQLYPDYIEHLIAYYKVLRQRNSLLKAAGNGAPNAVLLDTLDEQLARHGAPLHALRTGFLQEFRGKVQELYDYLSGNHESIALHYQSPLQETDLLSLLRANRWKDRQLQRTSAGVHRDDLLFLLGDHPLKSAGSQGQRKSFLFALKLAQYEALRRHKQLPPVLLLDDIFEKLDQDRISKLIRLVAGPEYGQVLITDTHPARLQEAFASFPEQLELIEIQ